MWTTIGNLYESIGSYFIPILLVLLISTGIISLIDKCIFEKKRKNPAALDGANKDSKYKKAFLKPPLLASISRDFFIVILIVFILRGFVFSLTSVPSQSMEPTILEGDKLIVSLYSYGIRLPLSNKVIIPIGSPHRGDIVVFKDVSNPRINLIKTVIGLPGDVISEKNKQVYINGKALPQQFKGQLTVKDNANLNTLVVKAYSQSLGDTKHMIYTAPAIPAANFSQVRVPKGQYFMMGDNRDNSEDSRYWGFAPEKNLIGKAQFIVWSSKNFHVRWHRLFKMLP